MKTKKLFVFIAAGALICLAGCGSGDGKRFDSLNKMLAEDYTKISLTVTDTFAEGSVLIGEYTITQAEEGKKVEYSVERFGEFSLDGSNEAKVILTGTAIVKDGEIVSTTGDAIDLPEGIGGGYTFASEYFANVKFGDGSLTADVTDAGNFFGCTITCTDMKVEASFGDALTSLNIGFTAADGTAVEYAYTFTA